MPFILHSFNLQKFQDLIAQPTPEQFAILRELFQFAIDSEREGSCFPGDPAMEWGTEARPLDVVLRERLTLPDWYEGLTFGGGAIFDRFLDFVYQSDELGLDGDLDCEGLSWEFMDEVFNLLMEWNEAENLSYLAMGRRPYRYLKPVPSVGEQTHDGDLAGGLMHIQEFLESCKSNPLGFQEKLNEDDTLAPAQKQLIQSLFNECLAEEEAETGAASGDDLDDEAPEYEPAHSVHLPDELRQMLIDLKSIEKPMKRNKEYVEEYTELAQILERLSISGRAMYVIADT